MNSHTTSGPVGKKAAVRGGVLGAAGGLCTANRYMYRSWGNTSCNHGYLKPKGPKGPNSLYLWFRVPIKAPKSLTACVLSPLFPSSRA